MLDSDCAQRARRDGQSPVLQESAAAEVARLMKGDPSHHGFARRWYEAMASLAEAETRWAEALAWAERGLRDFPESVEMLLVQASIEETQGVLELTQGDSGARSRGTRCSSTPTRGRAGPLLAVARSGSASSGPSAPCERRSPSTRRSRSRPPAGARGLETLKTAVARSSLRIVLARKPDARTAFLAHLFLGRLDEDAGRLDEAVASYEAALALDPHSQSARVALSHLRLRRGDAAEPARRSRRRGLGGPPPAARRVPALSLGALRRRRRPARGLAAGGHLVIALALFALAVVQAPPPTFTAGVEGVYVDVFVTDGNRPWSASRHRTSS